MCGSDTAVSHNKDPGALSQAIASLMSYLDIQKEKLWQAYYSADVFLQHPRQQQF